MAKSDAKADWLDPSISISANTDAYHNEQLVYGQDPASHLVKKVLRTSVGVNTTAGDQVLKARVVHVPSIGSPNSESWFGLVWPWATTTEPTIGKHPVVKVQVVSDNRDAFLQVRPPSSNSDASGNFYRTVSNPSGLEIGHGSEVDIVLRNPRMGFSTNPNIPAGTIISVNQLKPQDLNGKNGNCNPRAPGSNGSRTVSGSCNASGTPSPRQGPRSRNFISLPPPAATAQIVYPTNPVSVNNADQAPTPSIQSGYTSDSFFTKFATSGIGPRRTGLAGASTNHAGVDLVAPKGANIYASLPGKVVRRRLQGAPSTKVGYGWYVVIEHTDFVTPYGGPFYTLYAHLGPPLVRVGDPVSQKQKIGTSQNTGRSTGPHLHFEVLYDPRGNSKIGVKGEVIDSLEPISQFLFGPGFAIKGTTGNNPGGAYGGSGA